MGQADQIRQFILHHYIEPARAAGWNEVTIRAGDVHKAMGLVNRLPAVCSALEGRKILDLAGITISHRHGPRNGSNVFITYRLGGHRALTDRPARHADNTATANYRRAIINPGNSLILVSCVKSKRARSAPAQDLYTSTLFTGARAFARASGVPWYILSAKYGLVHPDTVIAPYEYTLNRLGVATRRAWARDVLAKLLPKTAGIKTVVFLAGIRYREFLIPPLKERKLDILIPMEGLRQGEQLQWLNEHT